MKKRSIRERKEAFKKAYYAELQKQGLINNNEAKQMTKTELIELAKQKGIEVNSRMTKAELENILKESDK